GGYYRLSDFPATIQLRHKAAGAGTQVVGKEKFITADDSSLARSKRLQVFQLRERIDVDLQLREIDNLAPPPARSEPQYLWPVFQARSKRFRLHHCAHFSGLETT